MDLLSPIQKKIINTSGNLMVSASAGTGKTHTLVHKILKEIQGNKSHKVIAAITFTIKAAQEIKNRITIDVSQHFIGTNNSFAIEEIIKPFMKDVFGPSYDIDMDTNYNVKIESFDEGIEKIMLAKTIPSYINKLKKNFIFELSKYIIENSEACQLYLKAKYFKIYIDEYQDCDKEMNELFMYLCEELGLETFIVGDEKQSIYIWRGAYPEAFTSIATKSNFSSIFMGNNFRSCQQIQNYSNLLYEQTQELYQPVDNFDDILLIECTKENWGEIISNYIKKDETTALLRFSNENASKGAFTLTENNHSCTYIKTPPIFEITTKVSWLYLAIAKFIILKHYSAYNLFFEIPSESDNKKVHIIDKKLIKIKENYKNFAVFREKFISLANYLNYETADDHILKLYETINDEVYFPAFEVENYKNIAITFHSSKGLEFDQVIIFAEDYPLNTTDSICNHYVASTRAKNKLFIIYINDSYN